ncbi:MAG: hypothetical protein Q9170_004146 [Blastenia crenularia]
MATSRPRNLKEETEELNGVMKRGNPHEMMKKLAELSRFQPPCECSECLTQYRALKLQDEPVWFYSLPLDDCGAFHIARGYTLSMIENIPFLIGQINAFGHRIVKRWVRRTSQSRKDFLLSVDSELYPVNNPIVDLATRLMGESVLEQVKYRRAYLLPYLNLDCLSSDPRNVLRLLHYRTSYLPEQWVIFDNAVIQKAWERAIRLPERSVEGCITMCGSYYGFWKPFDHDEVHQGHAYGAPRGLLILEAQSKLLRFLRKFCEVILANPDVPKASHPGQVTSASTITLEDRAKNSRKWSSMIDEGSPRSKDDPWQSFSSFYVNLPFSSPPSFDIDRMIEIAQNQATEAQDELWLLQTDPAYFHERAKYHESRWGDFAKLYRLTKRRKYSNIAFVMTIKALIRARDWQWILEECQDVKQLLDSCVDDIGMERSLPLRCSNALVALTMLLRKNEFNYKGNLNRCLLRSEGFGSMFELTHIGDLSKPAWAFGYDLRDPKTLYKRDRTGWCLSQLGKGFDDAFACPQDQVLLHLDEHLRTSKQEKQRIDQETNKWISDLAAVEKILTLLYYHRPKFQAATLDPEHLASLIQKPWLHLIRREVAVPKTPESTTLGIDGPLLPLSDFKMPKGTRDESWLARRDESHTALQKMWEAARGGYQRILELKDVNQDIIDAGLEQMKQGESTEHLYQLDLEKQEILDRLNAAKVHTLLSHKHEDFIPIAAPSGVVWKEDLALLQKDKIKTRPPDVQPAPSAPPTPVLEVQPPPLLYEIEPGTTAYRIVILLFPDPNDDPSKECLDWLEFVAAMAEFGLRAEHRGGSAFTFKGDIRLPEVPLETRSRSINFHMPHPSTEMSPVLLRSMGRRLNRRYGWERAHFGSLEMEA